jgi:catechol 2,3-dioxygenase-like lactoylglutathione lyase family enzyme
MSFRISGVDHVQLAGPPGCEDRARWFFAEVLGMEELVKPPALQARGGVWFRCGAHQLHIGIEPDFRPAQKAHPAFRVEDLAALKTRLRDAKVAFQEDALLPEAERIYVDDPFGNRLEFLQPAR